MSIVSNGITLKILGAIGNALTAGLRKTILETRDLALINQTRLESLCESIRELREDLRSLK